MQSKFTHSLIEITFVLLLVGHLFWNLSLFIHMGDFIAGIPAILQLIVFVLLFLRHPKLGAFIKLWAVYLLISGGIAVGSRVLLGISRDVFPEGIWWKTSIVLTGVLLYWIASRRIELVLK